MKKINEILQGIENLSVYELSQLIIKFNEKYSFNLGDVCNKGGVNCSEDTNRIVSISLVKISGNKISLIKLIKDRLKCSLKQSKDIVDCLPSILFKRIKYNDVVTFIDQLKQMECVVKVDDCS